MLCSGDQILALLDAKMRGKLGFRGLTQRSSCWYCAQDQTNPSQHRFDTARSECRLVRADERPLCLKIRVKRGGLVRHRAFQRML